MRSIIVNRTGGPEVLELQQLHEVVAEHDLARRDGEVPADLQLAGHHLPGAALVLGEVAQEVARPVEQAAAAGLVGRLQRLRVGVEEVRRRAVRQQLAQEESGLAAGTLRSLGLVGQLWIVQILYVVCLLH